MTGWARGLAFGIAVGIASSAAAYGPYTHAKIAAEAAARLQLDAQATTFYVAGALLADVDKSSRLADTLHSEGLAKLFQGCVSRGPIGRAVTHDPNGAVVTALLAHADPRARALGLGIRNHGLADRYADATTPSRLGHANSGDEDLAFDVASTRTDWAGAAATLGAAVRSGLLENPEVAGWLATAAKVAVADVSAQMRGYSCFVRNFVQGKAPIIAPLLRAALTATWTRACVASARGLGAKLHCVPDSASGHWKRFVNENRRVAEEAIGVIVADRARTR